MDREKLKQFQQWFWTIVMIIVFAITVHHAFQPTEFENWLGPYNDRDAIVQYPKLFDVSWETCRKFLRRTENGWWKADKNKMKELGIDIRKSLERYFSDPTITVPYPILVDYELYE